MGSIAGIRESFKVNASRARLARGAGVEFYKRNPFNFFLKSPSIFKRNPIKKITFNFIWKIPCNFFKNHRLETIFEKSHRSSVILKFLKISPTCPKFNTHKKVVVHFFIPMLLLPLTPSLIYLKLKRFKGPKMDSLSLHFTSLHFHFTFTSLSLSQLTLKSRTLVPRSRRLTLVESYTTYLRYRRLTLVESYTPYLRYRRLTFVESYTPYLRYRRARKEEVDSRDGSALYKIQHVQD